MGVSEKEIQKTYPKEQILKVVQSISSRLNEYKTVQFKKWNFLSNIIIKKFLKIKKKFI